MRVDIINTLDYHKTDQRDPKNNQQDCCSAGFGAAGGFARVVGLFVVRDGFGGLGLGIGWRWGFGVWVVLAEDYQWACALF